MNQDTATTCIGGAGIPARPSGQPQPQGVRRRTLRSSSPAFTLLEMLIVMGIIVLLLAIVLAVGPAVVKSQKVSQAKGLLSALDRALDEYKIANNAFPKIDAKAYAGVPSRDWALGGDHGNVYGGTGGFRTYNTVSYSRRPDAAVFLKAAAGYGEVDSIVHNMPSRFLQSTVNQDDKDATPSVLDPWSLVNKDAWALGRGVGAAPWTALQCNYILYVDSANPLAQELYGRCVNGRPYFVSAGPDGKFGLEDEFYDYATNSALPGDIQTQVEGSLADNITSYPVGVFNKDPNFYSSFRAVHP